MITPFHLLEHVIRPTLKGLNLWSSAAERLLLGTACQESACGQYLVQLGGGPALGIYQMEPATHKDIRQNFLRHRIELMDKVDAYGCDSSDLIGPQEMVGNLYYATAMCRIHYLRDPEPIPDTLPDQAKYYKRVYNTEKGKAMVEDYMASWRRYIGNQRLPD